MRKRDIKVVLKTMSDEQLIKECKEEYLLAKDESNVAIVGWALIFTGALFCFTIIVPLVFWVLGAIMVITKPRKHTKVSKVMMKELRKRNYKIIEKVNNFNGHNTHELIIIKNRW